MKSNMPDVNEYTNQVETQQLYLRQQLCSMINDENYFIQTVNLSDLDSDCIATEIKIKLRRKD